MKNKPLTSCFDLHDLRYDQIIKLRPFELKTIGSTIFCRLPKTVKLLVRHESGYIFNFDLKAK